MFDDDIASGLITIVERQKKFESLHLGDNETYRLECRYYYFFVLDLLSGIHLPKFIF